MDRRHVAQLEDASSQHVRGAVAENLVVSGIALVAHTGEAAVEFKTHDSGLRRTGADEGDRLSHCVSRLPGLGG